MATRIYLPGSSSTVVAPVAPGYGSTWTTVAATNRLGCSVNKAGTTIAALTAASYAETSATAVNLLMRQYVSYEQFQAGSVAGTFSAVVKGIEGANTGDQSLQIVLRIVSADGATERGVLYAGHSATLNATVGAIGQEFPSSAAQTRIFPAGTALSTVVAVAGDRLVIEVGHRFHNVSASSESGALTLGDNPAVADYALTAGLTTTLNPWVEFSADLLWQRVQRDPVGITDSVTVFAGAPLASTPADPVGITDSLNVFAGAPVARAPADPVGIADSLAVTMNAVPISQVATGFVGWGIPIR